ncbi:MAG: ABC transporter permease [Actinomycetota bacterium]
MGGGEGSRLKRSPSREKGLIARRPGTWRAVIAGPVLFLVVFFVVPVAMMIITSFRPDLRGGPLAWGWVPTLDHYRNIIGGGTYLPLLWTSVRVSLLVAFATCVLAYPVAYFLAFRVRRSAGLLLTLIILPFWTSYLLRTIAWKIILGSNGALNNFLSFIGVSTEPSPVLLYSRTAVVVTLIYAWLPFVALPIYAALLRIDRTLLEAAADLGAERRQSFFKVTLPLSAPGVLAAFVMVFIPTVGEYVAPLLVGGTRGVLFGNVVELFFGDGVNWPLGSAMALVMLALVLIIVGVAARLVGLRRLIEGSS